MTMVDVVMAWIEQNPNAATALAVIIAALGFAIVCTLWVLCTEKPIDPWDKSGWGV